MHVMCNGLAKRYSGNGMVECGRYDTLRLLPRPQQALDLHYLKSIIKEKLEIPFQNNERKVEDDALSVFLQEL